MPSWQARAFSAAIRVIVRRRDWGSDDQALAERARRVFGPPPSYGLLRAVGLRRTPVQGEHDGVAGEWLAPRRAGAGVVLYLHGGGFVSCSVATHRPIAAALARRTGCRVFSAQYRLAPEHRFPAAVDDAVAAYRWLLATGVSARAIAVVGDSAGGGLVLSLMRRVRAAGVPLPACGVCFSPWTDLTGNGASVRANDGRCAMFRPENMAQFARAYLGAASPREPDASPALAGDLGGLPPLLLQVGSTELLLDDARTIDAQVRAAGGASRLEVWEDVPHGWHMLDGWVPESGAALRQAAEFITEHVATR